MRNHYRRLKTIELTLTPEQVVFLWLGRAVTAGGFCDGWRSSPEPRTFIANAVSDVISERMKRFPEPLVRQAILEGRQHADLLYMLIVEVNMAVLESEQPTQRAFRLLAGYIRALARAPQNFDRLKELRSCLVQVIEGVLIVEDAIAQGTAEHFQGHEVLFRDTAKVLGEQLENVKKLAKTFNLLAHKSPIAKVDLELLRISIQSGVLEQVTEWSRLARLAMLSAFDPGDSWRVVADQLISDKPSSQFQTDCQENNKQSTKGGV